MILIRPAAARPRDGDDPRLAAGWTGTEVLLSPEADPARYVAAIDTAHRYALPLVVPRLRRDQLGRVVVLIGRLAPDLGLAAVVVTHGGDPCTARATFTALTLRQRLRPRRHPRRLT